jgi:hypothetical protein
MVCISHYKGGGLLWQSNSVIKASKTVTKSYPWRFCITSCKVCHRKFLVTFMPKCHRLIQSMTFLKCHGLARSPHEPGPSPMLMTNINVIEIVIDWVAMSSTTLWGWHGCWRGVWRGCWRGLWHVTSADVAMMWTLIWMLTWRLHGANVDNDMALTWTMTWRRPRQWRGLWHGTDVDADVAFFYQA